MSGASLVDDRERSWVVLRVCENGGAEVRYVDSLADLRVSSSRTGLRVPVVGFQVCPPMPAGCDMLMLPAAARLFGGGVIEPEVQELLRRVLRVNRSLTVKLFLEWQRAVTSLGAGPVRGVADRAVSSRDGLRPVRFLGGAAS